MLEVLEQREVPRLVALDVLGVELARLELDREADGAQLRCEDARVLELNGGEARLLEPPVGEARLDARRRTGRLRVGEGEPASRSNVAEKPACRRSIVEKPLALSTCASKPPSRAPLPRSPPSELLRLEAGPLSSPTLCPLTASMIHPSNPAVRRSSSLYPTARSALAAKEPSGPPPCAGGAQPWQRSQRPERLAGHLAREDLLDEPPIGPPSPCRSM